MLNWKKKKYKDSVVNGGKLNKVCGLEFFMVFPGLQRLEAPFLWVQGGHHSHEGFMTCFREEGKEGS